MNTIYRKSKVINTYALLLIELAVIVISYLLALTIKFGSLTSVDTRQEHLAFGILLMAMSLMYSIVTDWNHDFYIRGFFKEIVAVGKHTILIMVTSIIVMFLTRYVDLLSRTVFFVFFASNLIFTYLVHIVFKEFMLRCYKKSAGSDKLMLITTSDKVEAMTHQLLRDRGWTYELTSIALLDKDMTGSSIEGIPVIANADTLFEVATQYILDRVFISLPRTQIVEVREMIMDFEAMGILCHYNIDLEELNLEGKEAGSFAGFAVLSFSIHNMDYRRLLIKRFMDIAGSIVGIFFTILMYPFVAIAIKLESKGPVIFKQERIGKNGRRFTLYKFRSMYEDAEERLSQLKDKNEMQGLMFKMEDDPRITKVGRFLRRSSIDEFPQFFNVLKGDMSLVGTRPPTVKEFEQYNVHYRRRLSITPGLTGLWQVSGRSDIKDFDEVVRLDLEYIDRWSLGLDIKLILQTVGVVIFGRGSK